MFKNKIFAFCVLLFVSSFIALFAVDVNGKQPDFPVVQFDDQGISSIKYQEAELLVKGQLAIDAMTIVDGKMSSMLNQKDRKITVDGNSAIIEYPDFQAVLKIKSEKNNLFITVNFINKSTKDIAKISFKPFALKFPQRPKGNMWKWGYRVTTNNSGVPGVVEANYGNVKLLACVDEIERPVIFGFDGNYGNSTINPLIIETAKNDILKPGEEKKFIFSLRFSPGDKTSFEIANDIYTQFAKAYPYKLKWTDRRPIGALFMCQSAMKWPTNPRGWFNDKTVDITTDEGKKAFHDRLMKYADTCISIMKDTDSQGMILWDVEGEEMPHAITYLGDPRILPQSAPEMDACADEFFKKFTDAGLKTGVCIRPSKIVPNNKGGWAHLQVDDHITEMAEKIEYAKKRWGCTIFYMDTNVKWEKGMWSGDSWILPASDLYELTRRHPDVLIFPEFGTFGYWSCCMPYGELRGGNTRTNDTIKAVYPQAGTTITVGDGNYMGQYDNLFNGAKNGDIHLFRGWFGDPRNTDVKRLYQDVDYQRKSPAVQLKDLSFEKALQSADPVTRYASLIKVKADDKEAMALILKSITGEKDWVVQKQMIALLGESGEEKSIPILTSIIKDKSRNLDYFAARALGKTGIPATTALIELLSDKDSRVVEKALLALSMYQDDKSLPAILPLTEHKNLAVSVAATRALGQYKNTESVDKLITLLDSDKPEIIMAACGALGEIKDKKACKPLVDAMVKAVTVLKNNNLRAAAGDALESITGLEYGPHEQRWKKALAEGKI